MKDNISTLLDYLWHHYESWISAAELSQLLHVSTRQIRKYISILNEEHVEEPLVISTNKGYKLSARSSICVIGRAESIIWKPRRHGRI